MTNQNITLNGVDPFTVFGNTYTWYNQGITAVYFGDDNATGANSLSLTLAGAPWKIGHLDFYNTTAFGFNTVLTDTNDGVARRIDWLTLQDNGNATITLYNTRVRYISGGDGGNVTLTLGGQPTTTVELWGTTNNVTLGSGQVQAVMRMPRSFGALPWVCTSVTR